MLRLALGSVAYSEKRARREDKMRSFKQLENDYARTLVTLEQCGTRGAGVLALKGPETRLTLTTPEMLREGCHPNGWFDLRLKSSKGEGIFLHNALFLTQTMPNKRHPEYEDTIYPNMVAFGTESFTANGEVQAISFTTEKLADFFNYEVVEWQSLHQVPADALKALKQIRTYEKKYPREYEFFNPTNIYLVHELPPVLTFRVEDRTYEVFVGAASRLHWNAAQVSVHPVATIRFEKPIKISDGLDHVWEWRRFFTQLAMERLPFNGISLGSGHSMKTVPADLYLPGFKEESPRKNRPFAFYPGVAPFTSWGERDSLARLMKGWLEKQPQRQRFRTNLDHVVCAMQDSVDLDHILTLAAGLESLDEFDQAIYSKADIEVLARGASAAAKEAGVDVAIERITGVLGLLRKQNLRRRLEALWTATAALVPHHDGREFVRSVYGLRNGAAHPSSNAFASSRQLSPVIQAFASLCAVWDLMSSGLDITQTSGRINPLLILSNALAEIDHAHK